MRAPPVPSRPAVAAVPGPDEPSGRVRRPAIARTPRPRGFPTLAPLLLAPTLLLEARARRAAGPAPTGTAAPGPVSA